MEKVGTFLLSLVEARSTETPERFRDVLMVVFAFIFGWRDSTVCTLLREHVWLQDDWICFHEDFCKGF
jgi:hypothetical protein